MESTNFGSMPVLVLKKLLPFLSESTIYRYRFDIHHQRVAFWVSHSVYNGKIFVVVDENPNIDPATNSNPKLLPTKGIICDVELVESSGDFPEKISKPVTVNLIPRYEAEIDPAEIEYKRIDVTPPGGIIDIHDNSHVFYVSKPKVRNIEFDISSFENSYYLNEIRKKFKDVVLNSTDERYRKLDVNKIFDGKTLLQMPIQVFNTLLVNSKQVNNYLEYTKYSERMAFICSVLELLANFPAIDSEIESKVQASMNNNQRKYYLSEKARVISQELNGTEDGGVEAYLEKLKTIGAPKEVEKKIESEIKRLEMIPQASAESYIQRNYIEWALDLPFSGDKLEKVDLKKARETLNSDHYGLDEVKERVLEYLAVLSRTDLTKSPILCLIGPPGVGKTSLGKSLAAATGRKYTRFALGGLQDEAEIRGHRRTYIGSQPGRIVQLLSKAKVNNPLFLLDEIDKVSQNHKGDPSSALLEVLDPEQNNSFNDNYMEFPYDLSNVLFVATANSYDIQPALLDRMEVIDLSSYTFDEKFEIARRHILPRLIRRNAIKNDEIIFPEKMISYVIDGYTNEPGVRSLERRLERIIRYVIKDIIENGKKSITVDEQYIEKVLGPVFNELTETERNKKSYVGYITGLAYTSVGGSTLPIEVAVTPGKGKIQSTGSLGDNIKESIAAATTVIRQRCKQYGLEPDFYEKNDIHVHFPNAAVKKDGPSAGGAITTCLLSALTGKPIDLDIGMTGEISLQGRILRIGGIKEKVISAHRDGVRHIILPKSNEADLYKIPDNIKAELQFYPVETFDEVYDIVFGDKKRPTKVVEAKPLAEEGAYISANTIPPEAPKENAVESVTLANEEGPKVTETVKVTEDASKKAASKKPEAKKASSKKATTSKAQAKKEEVEAPKAAETATSKDTAKDATKDSVKENSKEATSLPKSETEASSQEKEKKATMVSTFTKGKITLELKMEAVRLVKEEGKSQTEVAEILGVSQKSVFNWVQKMKKEGTLESQQGTPDKVKAQAIAELEATGASRTEIAKKYGVSVSSIGNWIKEFEKKK